MKATIINLSRLKIIKSDGYTLHEITLKHISTVNTCEHISISKFQHDDAQARQLNDIKVTYNHACSSCKVMGSVHL